jgi:hypothetical protein
VMSASSDHLHGGETIIPRSPTSKSAVPVWIVAALRSSQVQIKGAVTGIQRCAASLLLRWHQIRQRVTSARKYPTCARPLSFQFPLTFEEEGLERAICVHVASAGGVGISILELSQEINSYSSGLAFTAVESAAVELVSAETLGIRAGRLVIR